MTSYIVHNYFRCISYTKSNFKCMNLNQKKKNLYFKYSTIIFIHLHRKKIFSIMIQQNNSNIQCIFISCLCIASP